MALLIKIEDGQCWVATTEHKESLIVEVPTGMYGSEIDVKWEKCGNANSGELDRALIQNANLMTQIEGRDAEILRLRKKVNDVYQIVTPYPYKVGA